MSYKASSGISIAEWHAVQKLVSELSQAVNQRLDEVGADTVKSIRENVTALQIAIAAINTAQEVQDNRLEAIENTAANKEITPLEVQQAWGV